MAEADVHRRRGIPWWGWFLGLFLVLAVIWALTRTTTTGVAERHDGDALTLDGVLASDNRAGMAGQNVQVTSATVLDVISDRAFWVGDAAGRQIMVVLDSGRIAPPGERGYDFRSGQTISFFGTVERLPSWEEAQERWNLDPGLRDRVGAQDVYLRAHQLEIASPPW
jgi:hypothetical protein